MDGISAIGASSYTMQPQYSATSDTPASTAAPAQDEVVLSGGDGTGTANTYSGPDAAFTRLMQSDPGLAQDYAADNQFGFEDSVLSSAAGRRVGLR